MLVNSKKKDHISKFFVWAALAILVLLAVKFIVQSQGTLDWGGRDPVTDPGSTPTAIRSSLYTEDLISLEKNKIYKEGNLSLYLNNELGTPTLLVVYSDSISDLQRNGRFLVFLYLKDPSKWRNINAKWDHILLTKEQLTPTKKIINDTTRYLFKFGLDHPYFSIDNLDELEFVRHTRELGRFEDIKVSPDDLSYKYDISNTLGKLRISMKASQFTKIANKRGEALKSGILITSDDDLVNARIRTEGKNNIPAKIRLKGDWTDHLDHPSKWSYRIMPEGEETIFRMRKFSLQHPKSRNYLWEWLFNKVVKDNGLVGLRYDFLNVDLKIVDKDSTIPMGIMAMEESFDKILIENNRRREGLILGFDESAIWDERKQVMDLNLNYPEDVDLPKAGELPVKVYNENKSLRSPVLSRQFEVAKNLFLGLRDGELELSEAFDVDKLTRYIALSNLFGGQHGLHIENIRIYYNPVTNKLEPVSFDSNSGYELKLLNEYPIGIHDDLFREKLVANYELVSSEKFIDEIVRKYEDELNELSLNLTGEFNDAALDFGVLQHNANFIKKKIHPANLVRSSLLSYGQDSMEIELMNISDFPVVIEDLVLENKKSLNKNKKTLIIGPRDTANFKFQLKRSFNNAFVSKKNKEGGFRYPKDLGKIRLSHHLLGSGAKKYSPIAAFNSNLDEDAISAMQLRTNFGDFDFIIPDEKAKILTFKKGSHSIDRVVHIPSDYIIEIEAGFELNLRNNASIISYSPWLARGTKDEPIRFFSEDSTGGGIFISSPEQKSVLTHTYFTNLSVPETNYWSLSGSVNFNETTVELSNCIFEKNRSEDALNIIRSDFMMDSIQFKSTYSDAFDGDFVKGRITNSVFTDSGNDGIDISGSDITVQNITIVNPSDKGMSAGEGSTISGNAIEIRDGEIGLVSKDLSRITISDIAILNTRLAISCFQKKSEYGPGLIDLKDVRFSGNEVSYLIEPNSDLIIDNKLILEKTEGVIEKMYGNEYGKSSQ